MNEVVLVQLLGRLGSKDGEEALHDLFAMSRRPLKRFLFRLCRCPMLSEDLVQNTFLRLWTYRGRFSKIGSARGYLYSVARNEWRQECAKVNRREKVMNDYRFGWKEITNQGPSESAEISERISAINAAIMSLPLEQREVLVLHRFERICCREIAAILELSSKTVESRLRLALEKLTQKLVRSGEQS